MSEFLWQPGVESSIEKWRMERKRIGERRRLRERYKKVRRVKRANGVRRRSWLENIKRKVKKVVVNLKNQNTFECRQCVERLGRLNEDCKEDFSDGQNLDASLRAKFCTDSIE